ncbi:protein kinase [Nonomuraea sp. NPDC052634]|uniref:serine/threonine-protein kinase n=1 Tax=Nonomuraea sp. NPDC052634 TaxID=3155813 RepID=UPI0034231773
MERRLGSGGQGVVYAGRAPGGPLVAIKLLHAHLVADDGARDRFLREVETAKRVAPFCTAQLLDSGFAWSRPYIVSEYVPGPSLQTSVRDDGPRGAAALHRLAINTATALAAIHAAGVVHRDFKPANVLLGPDGPVVIDFGIAKALDQSLSVISSQPFGSPAYMAPEQISGGEVGPPADMFAWAATMYYAATGRRAFGGEGIPATLHAVLTSEPDLTPLDERLRWLLRDCLAKDPARRPASAQVVERLRAFASLTDPRMPSLGPAPSPGNPPCSRDPSAPGHPSAPGNPPGNPSSPGGPPSGPFGVVQGPPSGPFGAVQGRPSGPSGAVQGPPSRPFGAVQGPPSADTGPSAQVQGAALDTGPTTRGRTRALKVAVPVGAVAVIAATGIGWYALSPAVSRPEAAARTPVPTATQPPPQPTAETTTEEPAEEPAEEPTEERKPAEARTRRAKDLASSRPRSATPTAPRRVPATTAAPTPASVPTRTSVPTRKASATPTRRPATRTPEPTAKASRSPASKRTSAAPAPEPTTGTISWSDVDGYCKAKGYSGSYTAGWTYTGCNGSDSTIDLAAVCRWKYPGYSNVSAKMPANPWIPTTTCDLS